MMPLFFGAHKVLATNSGKMIDQKDANPGKKTRVGRFKL